MGEPPCYDMLEGDLKIMLTPAYTPFTLPAQPSHFMLVV
jgi:hypothetical protein